MRLKAAGVAHPVVLFTAPVLASLFDPLLPKPRRTVGGGGGRLIEVRGRWLTRSRGGGFISSPLTPPGLLPVSSLLGTASTHSAIHVLSRKGYGGRVPFRAAASDFAASPGKKRKCPPDVAQEASNQRNNATRYVI